MALQAARSPARLGAGRLPRRIVAARALNYRAASLGPSRSEALQRAIQVRIRHRSPYCLRLQPGLGRMGAHVVHAHPHSRLQPQGGVSRRVQARRPRRCCSRRAARPRAARTSHLRTAASMRGAQRCLLPQGHQQAQARAAQRPARKTSHGAQPGASGQRPAAKRPPGPTQIHPRAHCVDPRRPALPAHAAPAPSTQTKPAAFLHRGARRQHAGAAAQPLRARRDVLRRQGRRLRRVWVPRARRHDRGGLRQPPAAARRGGESRLGAAGLLLCSACRLLRVQPAVRCCWCWCLPAPLLVLEQSFFVRLCKLA